MGKNKKINDLDSLEQEIDRLQDEARAIEKQLGNNLSHLRENAMAFAVNSIFCAKKKEDKQENGHRFFKNEKLNTFFGKVTENITDRIGDLLDKMWNRQKQ